MEYKIKKPKLIITLIANSVLLLAFINMWRLRIAPPLDYIYLILSIVALFMIIVTIARFAAKPYDLRLHPGKIYVKNREVDSTKIRAVLIRGYFNPMIGIQLANRRMVPVGLYFRFIGREREDHAIRDLKQWAKEHDVPVVHRYFWTWF
ncbi:hypothetical protein [Paenibacillus sp. JCM 10914]|uniref:hypothetical protein n=1 Tax=Paenibacillus sp. JCM 10914 TaxID=1236974 RepID=UPI0011DD0C5D|nr:hypothetical protein [Paenibacillus sp. JCM 10914]